LHPCVGEGVVGWSVGWSVGTVVGMSVGGAVGVVVGEALVGDVVQKMLLQCAGHATASCDVEHAAFSFPVCRGKRDVHVAGSRRPLHDSPTAGGGVGCNDGHAPHVCGQSVKNSGSLQFTAPAQSIGSDTLQSTLGATVGAATGASVGTSDGAREGVAVGERDGARVGRLDGTSVGEVVGSAVGAVEGVVVGAAEGGGVHIIRQCPGQFNAKRVKSGSKQLVLSVSETASIGKTAPHDRGSTVPKQANERAAVGDAVQKPHVPGHSSCKEVSVQSTRWHPLGSGNPLQLAVGDTVGVTVGSALGLIVGTDDGTTFGCAVGDWDGVEVGKVDGRDVGCAVGDAVGGDVQNAWQCPGHVAANCPNCASAQFKLSEESNLTGNSVAHDSASTNPKHDNRRAVLGGCEHVPHVPGHCVWKVDSAQSTLLQPAGSGVPLQLAVGDVVGANVGVADGDLEGVPVGEEVGEEVGLADGRSVGEAVGDAVGISVGAALGGGVQSAVQ
jgi:hypothetical protein